MKYLESSHEEILLSIKNIPIGSRRTQPKMETEEIQTFILELTNDKN